jgi:hypothetical protein
VPEIEHGLQPVMAAYKEVCKDTQKKAKQLKMISFFFKSSVSRSAMQSALFDYHDN